MGTATALGKAPRLSPPQKVSKSTLGGPDLKKRFNSQRRGNQFRSPNIYEQILEKAKDKFNKNNKTDTGKLAEPVDTEPTQSTLTGFHE